MDIYHKRKGKNPFGTPAFLELPFILIIHRIARLYEQGADSVCIGQYIVKERCVSDGRAV